MSQETASSTNEEKRRSIKDLLVWLFLIPLILGTLLCCGQMAWFFLPGELGRDTSSRLSADYRPWPYDKIPPINVEAFLKDIETQEATIVVGEFWVMPTSSTSVVVAQISDTTEPPVSNPTDTPEPPRPESSTPTRLVTNTPVIPTSTLPPTSTPLPSITPTRPPTSTLPPPPQPPTATSAPPRPTRTPVPPTYTWTPTRPATLTPTPITPTPTTVTPTTVTPTTITPTVATPTYAPVRPIAENDGVADQVANGGCRAYFGYQNDNPNEVDIPIGPRNTLDDPAGITNPPQPTHFLVGWVPGAFEFTWYSGLDLTWTLDGRTAVAFWCY